MGDGGPPVMIDLPTRSPAMRPSALIPAVLAVLLCLALPATANAAQPAVSVSPTAVAPGDTITVSGRNWPKRVSVQLLVGPPRSEADAVATVRTTSRGTFRRTIRIASTAELGRYVLLACRRSCRVKAQASLRIVALSTTRRCGFVDVPGGRAWDIRTAYASCRSARQVAKTCLRGTHPAGWLVGYSPATDRTTLRSGSRTVSFRVVGAGGCAEIA
jgi:hypothetical protein